MNTVKDLLRPAKKAFVATAFLLFTTAVQAQDDTTAKKTMEIYGFIMMDAGYNGDQIHPDWYDVVRPTKLPSYKNEFGPDGNTYFSVRQTRLGFKNFFPTGKGELKTQFELELFGTGPDAGQTTLRLVHAYAELGKWGVGQYWSPFMDIDVFPTTVEYWGPSGMAFFRNIQLRYMPIQGATRLTIALEQPGASADQGEYAGRIELQSVKPKFPVPDLSAEFRLGGNWGYVELGAIGRRIEWKDLDSTGPDLSGGATGFGVNLSTNIKFGNLVTFRGSVVHGEGIENYMNDAPVDVGIKTTGNPNVPIEGVALPVFGVSAFVDINWSKGLSTSLGYSSIDIDNSNGQSASAFKKGQYIVGNIMFYPIPHGMMGVEFQYGDRENFKDGWSTSISKAQVSFKYNFSQSFFKSGA